MISTPSLLSEANVDKRKRMRKTSSCFNCRRSELKCNRLVPCQHCSSRNMGNTCTFESSQLPGSEMDLLGWQAGSSLPSVPMFSTAKPGATEATCAPSTGIHQPFFSHQPLPRPSLSRVPSSPKTPSSNAEVQGTLKAIQIILANMEGRLTGVAPHPVKSENGGQSTGSTKEVERCDKVLAKMHALEAKMDIILEYLALNQRDWEKEGKRHQSQPNEGKLYLDQELQLSLDYSKLSGFQYTPMETSKKRDADLIAQADLFPSMHSIPAVAGDNGHTSEFLSYRDRC